MPVAVISNKARTFACFLKEFLADFWIFQDFSLFSLKFWDLIVLFCGCLEALPVERCCFLDWSFSPFYFRSRSVSESCIARDLVSLLRAFDLCVCAGVAIVDLEEIEAKMNHCAMQQNAFAAACEEMRAPFAFVDRKAPIFCPRPRRFSPLAAVVDPVRPVRWQSSHQSDFSDSNAGPDPLDIFLTKDEELDQLATSPPFFCGSPPSRAANPVVHDARFGENHPPALFAPSPLTLSGPPMSPKQGCAHDKFGVLPATVRVEGFDCLNRDGRSCSGIAAVA